ncbi:MAG: hypothetical protein VW600_07855, partial [Ferrovibrio sp.]
SLSNARLFRRALFFALSLPARALACGHALPQSFTREDLRQVWQPKINHIGAKAGCLNLIWIRFWWRRRILSRPAKSPAN